MSSSRPTLPRRLLLVAAAAGIGGCGFRLREPARMAFGSITLAGFAPRSPLELELRRQLEPRVKLLEAPARAAVVLEALEDVREKSVVATTAAAQVREMQLRLKFSFRARTPDGRDLIPRAELLLTRDLSYNETNALAKEAEEAELYRNMQTDMVQQVLRRLASIVV
ncbi:MAG: hypothetical protein H7Z19_03180 [Chitinophagaceae bacterium]|nr:hypothetical protein [Rubrivivax sp.]